MHRVYFEGSSLVSDALDLPEKLAVHICDACLLPHIAFFLVNGKKPHQKVVMLDACFGRERVFVRDEQGQGRLVELHLADLESSHCLFPHVLSGF